MKKIKLIAIIGIAMVIGLLAIIYIAVIAAKMPINLPFIEAKNLVYDPVEGEQIAEEWKNVVIYEYDNTPDDVQEIIESADVDKETKESLFKSLEDIVDTETLNTYIESNSSVIENGYEKLFIDEVDQQSTPTGIKTVHGDDVLAIDKVNGIIIIGVNIPYDDKIAKAKLAIVDNKKQLDMSIVEDLQYWDQISEHISREKAILGINANGYTWNDNGDWATMYGLAKYHGQIYRKANNRENSICFDEEGNMSIGGDVESSWNATEGYPILIRNGQEVYSVTSDSEANVRMAQTAIGQTSSGKTLLLVASGGIYGSNSGATTSEILGIMNKYNAYNASMLSGGSRTVMCWNNRIISLSEGYREEGVLLPTAIVVKPNNT